GTRGGILASFRKTIPEVDDASAYAARLTKAFATLLETLGPAERGRVRAYYQVEEDERFVKALADAHELSFEASRVSLDTFESFYSTGEIVVSNRLHCLLLGAYCGL